MCFILLPFIGVTTFIVTKYHYTKNKRNTVSEDLWKKTACGLISKMAHEINDLKFNKPINKRKGVIRNTKKRNRK